MATRKAETCSCYNSYICTPAVGITLSRVLTIIYIVFMFTTHNGDVSPQSGNISNYKRNGRIATIIIAGIFFLYSWLL